MRLRSSKKRTAQQPAAAASDDVGQPTLPPELMHILASRLSPEELAAASQTCKAWARLLRAGITQATVLVGDNDANAEEQRAKAAIRSLAKHSAVSSLQLLLNARSSYETTRDVVSSLGLLRQLETLVLRFMVTPTSKMGIWPIFFAEQMDASRLSTLVVDCSGHGMAPMALQILLGRIIPPGRLAHLTLNLGAAQLPGSQLPLYSSPSWLRFGDVGNTTKGLDPTHLAELATLKSLRSLACPLAYEVSAKHLKRLTKLTALTRLELQSRLRLASPCPPITGSMLRLMPAFKSLRELKCSMIVIEPPDGILATLQQDLTHLQKIDLTLWAPDTNTSNLNLTVKGLLAHPPTNLRGLALHWTTLDDDIDSLAGLTGLTSLQLINVFIPQPISSISWDLTPLSRLTKLQHFALDAPTAGDTTVFFGQIDGLRFAEPPPAAAKPERVLTGACQSVGKRGPKKAAAEQQQQQQQQQQDLSPTLMGDIAGLWTAWPQLRALQLQQLTPEAVASTVWSGLSRLEHLTSLQLQFHEPNTQKLGRRPATPGVKLPLSGPGGGKPLLQLGALPGSLVKLQLDNAYLLVPAAGSIKCGEHLTSLSLSRCFMATTATGRRQQGGVCCASPGDFGRYRIVCDAHASLTSPPPPEHPLLQLLAGTRCLSQLELIHLHWLRDDLLAAAAALPALRRLGTLSVLGVGNQAVTHGGLLGLTPLTKLRRLRWHVGDALELLPDVAALAQLRGLVALHVPTWLHAQMERWGAYAVLNSLPLCDVHVEVVGG